MPLTLATEEEPGEPIVTYPEVAPDAMLCEPVVPPVTPRLPEIVQPPLRVARPVMVPVLDAVMVVNAPAAAVPVPIGMLLMAFVPDPPVIVRAPTVVTRVRKP